MRFFQEVMFDYPRPILISNWTHSQAFWRVILVGELNNKTLPAAQLQTVCPLPLAFPLAGWERWQITGVVSPTTSHSKLGNQVSQDTSPPNKKHVQHANHAPKKAQFQKFLISPILSLILTMYQPLPSGNQTSQWKINNWVRWFSSSKLHLCGFLSFLPYFPIIFPALNLSWSGFPKRTGQGRSPQVLGRWGYIGHEQTPPPAGWDDDHHHHQ